jgi:hypothetical protein
VTKKECLHKWIDNLTNYCNAMSMRIAKNWLGQVIPFGIDLVGGDSDLDPFCPGQLLRIISSPLLNSFVAFPGQRGIDDCARIKIFCVRIWAETDCVGSWGIALANCSHFQKLHMIQAKRKMATIAWNPHGFHLVDTLPKGESFTATYYIEHILQPILEYRAKSGLRQFITHADDARPHAARKF